MNVFYTIVGSIAVFMVSLFLSYRKGGKDKETKIQNEVMKDNEENNERIKKEKQEIKSRISSLSDDELDKLL